MGEGRLKKEEEMEAQAACGVGHKVQPVDHSCSRRIPREQLTFVCDYVCVCVGTHPSCLLKTKECTRLN